MAEIGVYVTSDARGKRVGHDLLEALITASEEVGIWTLEARVLEENQVVVHLCQSVGFRIVGVRERIGFLDGEWRNVVLLERRSNVVGVGSPG
jgi:phosphinothricin acetyltransferase